MPALTRLRIACFLSCLLLFSCSSAKTNRKELAEKLVDGIPLQSTPAQVLEYLDNHKTKHSQFLRDPQKGNLIQAMIPYDPSKWQLTYTSYGIEFRFDDLNRLTSKEIHEKYTGP